MLHFVFAYQHSLFPLPHPLFPFTEHDKMCWAWIWVSFAFMICVSWIILSRAQFIIKSQGLHVLANSDECLTVAGPLPLPLPLPPPLFTFLKGRKKWNRKLKLCRAPATNWFPQSFGNFQGVVTFPKMFRNFLSTLSLIFYLSFPIPLSHRFAFKLGKKTTTTTRLLWLSLSHLIAFLLVFFSLHSLLVFCCVCVCVCHNKMAPCVCVCVCRFAFKLASSWPGCVVGTFYTNTQASEGCVQGEG